MTKALNIKDENEAFFDVLFDSDVKIVGAYVRGSKQIDPSTNIIEEGSSRANEPIEDCFDKPTDSGVLLCVAYESGKIIGSWF